MTMGFLTDLRTGKRNTLGAGGASIVFWMIVEIGAGLLIDALYFGAVERSATILSLLGGAGGVAVGFYAAFGKSKVATVLGLPGALFELVR